MKGSPLVRGLLVSAFCALLLSSASAATSPLATETSSTNSASSSNDYPSASWALGIVVPEGAQLQGGGSLRWEDVHNLTATFMLPNISMPERTVYAVLSVMTGDGSVLQAAVGIRPNESEWSSFSWSISNVGSVPLSYHWNLNGSGPGMVPGAEVAISIYWNSSSWCFRVLDRDTGTSVERPLDSARSGSLKVGDQEAFALEAYSGAAATFRDMGNLTLQGVFADGRRVTGGTYPYSEWDPSHSPLFVVGSSGTGPPDFISFTNVGGGSFVWSYSSKWQGGTEGYPSGVGAALAILLSSAFGVTLVLIVLLTKKKL